MNKSSAELDSSTDPPDDPRVLSKYPGGDQTFFGSFQRVKMEGRRGRGYWEWKSAERGNTKRNGHEGDDELTSLESDTLTRRLPHPTKADSTCHPDTCGIRVLPPFALTRPDPRKTSNQPDRIKITSYNQPHLKPILKSNPPPPSAPPKDLVYADATIRHTERGVVNHEPVHPEPSCLKSAPVSDNIVNVTCKSTTKGIKDDQHKGECLKQADSSENISENNGLQKKPPLTQSESVKSRPKQLNKHNNNSRRSGALVWVNQPGGGAKLEWIPTPGLSIRAQTSSPIADRRKPVVKGGSVAKEATFLSPTDKVRNEGGEKMGDARADGLARVDLSVPSRSGGDGSFSGAPHNTQTSTASQSAVANYSQPPKNVHSSAPGDTRPEGRTNQLTSILTGSEGKSPRIRPPGTSEDKIVTVPGRTQGQVVRIRVRPEVHAYLSNLPVINTGLDSSKKGTTERRDSFQSGNSSSASGLTWGSGEGSLGYQEQDYEAVVDEYTLLKKAVDDQDPEAIRLLTASSATVTDAGDGTSEYPYLREMKERLLIANEPTKMASDLQQEDNQLLEVHQTPVGTVVKLNSDGSHTSATHRVESLYTDTLQSRRTNRNTDVPPKNAKTSSFITLSLLYATLLVVVCLGFVLSEVLTHNVPLYYYEAFFTYLYGMSLLFLLYVFCYLLSDSTKEKKPPKPKKSKKSEAAGGEGSPTQEKLTSPVPKPKKTKTSDNDHSHGSFFLRIGAIAFGLGTMIYNGLEFGVFLEIPQESPCFQILRGVNPLLQLVFTFMQMYFIFMNARLNIHKFKFLARFGLMHIVATNMCVWIRTLVRESLKEINEFRVTQGHTGEDFMIMEGIRRALENKGLMAPNKYMYNLEKFSMGSEENDTLPYDGTWTSEEDVMNRSCERMEIMGSIVSDSAPYLYPFLVEYSLIAAAVVFIMWKHIGRNPRLRTDRFIYDVEIGDQASVVSRRCHAKVDCVGASKGLFCGLLVLVATMICLILFFVLIHKDDLKMLAIYLADVSHCGIMFLSIIAIFIGFCRVRHLKFYGDREEELDDILLLVSAFGLFAYAVFSAVAGSLSAFTEEPNLLVMSTGIFSIVQVIIQMVFIKDVQRRQVALPEHERTKPGRQIVTFLLICNLAMWVIYTFETEKVEQNPVQLQFFGKLSWTILLRCTLPLAIFHRFHSTVVLASIWKNSYKPRVE